MQLKKLELYGFKSFSDRTSIEFDKGITGVVGPNGSGKSNIVDSVMWVLGEQSAKNLRGAKMDDVVFKGSDKRKPNGFAEVTLTLDNSDNALPINFAEVQVSRRLYRSGESRYCINGADVRLKDITNLFLDSGVGKYGYSIIGQGRVSEILNASPEGRRYIFDEAAGIMKYKTRKEESEKHLFLTNENLSRANDLISEIERSLPQLKIAAAKAEKYITVAEKLKKSETTRFVLLHERYLKQTKKLEEQINLLSNDIEQNESKKASLNEKLEDINIRYDSLSEQAEKLRQNRMESIRTVERLKGEYRYAADRLVQIEKDEKVNSDNIERFRAEAESLVKLIESETKRQEEYRKAKEETDKLLEAKTAEAEKIRAEYEKVSGELDAARGRNADSVSKENEAKLRLAELTTKKDMLSARRDDGAKALGELKARLAETEEVTKASKENLDVVYKKLSDLNSEFEELSKKYAAADENTQELRKRFEALSKQTESRKSRINTLNELKESMEAFNNSTRAVIKLRNSDKVFSSAIVGTVSDIIRVEKEYETAMEVALGAAVQNIVTTTDTAAKEIIEYLRQNRLGYATFLPLNSVQPRTVNDSELRLLRQKGFLGIASELVTYDSKYKAVIQNLLGRVVIAENMDSAINIARQSRYMFRIVTLEGDVINPYGSISGGSRGKSNVSNVFSRSREIDELEEAQKKDLAELRKIYDELETIKASGSKLRTEYEEKRTAVHNADIEYSSAKKSHEFVLGEYAKAKKQCTDKETENRSLATELSDVSVSITKINSELEQRRKELLGTDNDLSQLTSEEADLRERLTSEEIKLTDLKLKQMECDSKYQVTSASLNEQVSRRDERNSQAEELKTENEALVEEKKQLSEKSGELDALIKNAEKAEKDEADVLSGCEEDLKELSKTKKACEDEIRIYESLILDINAKLHDFDMDKTKVMMESDNLQSRMWEVYQVSLGDALKAEPEEGDLEDLNKAIRELKADITRMGPINPEAPQQYEEQSVRFEKLTKEREDLIRAGKDIEKLIAEITKEMRVRFEEEFKIINEYFNEMFKKLFNGGTARLELVESDDILEAGIDIIAQLPGKKLQNILLMSGGEKALVAIALVFALLKRRPAPFCILDEIDTALDEKNVYNLAELVKSFNDSMQFIIISHRKGTMEASNALYGVSMEEKGVSSLVSVRLEDAAREDA